MDKPTESVVLIDEHRLDKECIKLPSDYLRHAHLAADARREVDERKAQLDVIESELGSEMRKDPETHLGLEKVTETAIKAAIPIHERYKKGLARLQAARHASDLAHAVVSALEMKKKSLEGLIQLHGMGYFASPKMSREDRDKVTSTAMQRMTRRANRE